MEGGFGGSAANTEGGEEVKSASTAGCVNRRGSCLHSAVTLHHPESQQHGTIHTRDDSICRWTAAGQRVQRSFLLL